MKYIPIEKNSPVNIKKIKNMLEDNSSKEDSEILHDEKYFSSKQAVQRREDDAKKSNKEPYFLSNTLIHREEPRGKINSSYLNRYGASQTTRNNQIHFMPKNIEMKSTIESKNKYIRTSLKKGLYTSRQPEN